MSHPIPDSDLVAYVASLGQKITALEENARENARQSDNKLNLVNNELNLVKNELQSIRLDLGSNYVSKTLFKESNESKVSCKLLFK